MAEAKYRHYEIESASDWGPAGTKIFPIEFDTPCTEIIVRGIFTAGTTTWAAAAAANFTKIELKDGSTTVWAGTGKAIQGHWMRSSGISPSGYTHLRNTKQVGVNIVLSFGRWLGDEKYALDPKKFGNLHLDVTWDEDVHNTSCTVNSIGITATLLNRPGVNPVGMLRLWEVEAYNAVASAWKTIDLPVDRPVRYLYFQTQVSQVSLASSCSDVKLTRNGDREVLYDDTTSAIMRWANTRSPLFEQHYRVHVATSGDTYFSTIGSIIGGTTGSYDAAKASGFASHMGGSFKMRVETTSQYYTADIVGYNPQGMFDLPLCDENDDATWFTPSVKDLWQLKLKAGANSGTTTFYVYVEQLYIY